MDLEIEKDAQTEESNSETLRLEAPEEAQSQIVTQKTEGQEEDQEEVCVVGDFFYQFIF